MGIFSPRLRNCLAALALARQFPRNGGIIAIMRSVARMAFLLLLGVHLGAGAETVYRSVDKDGVPIFSDTPSSDAEEIEIEKAPAVPFVAPPKPGVPPATVGEEKPQDVAYVSLVIVSPAADQALRTNEGKVSVSTVSEPALASGDQLVLYLDGKEVFRGGGGTQLSGIGPGTHSLVAAIVGADGSERIRSESVTFHLLRTTALTRRLIKEREAKRALPPPSNVTPVEVEAVREVVRTRGRSLRGGRR